VKEDKIQIKQFKCGSSDWFVNQAHYNLNKDGEIIWCAGETDKKELRDALESFIRRNKKSYKERPLLVFDQEQIEYITLTFGKFAGKKLNELVEIDRKYASWLHKNTTDERIKEQLKILLKR